MASVFRIERDSVSAWKLLAGRKGSFEHRFGGPPLPAGSTGKRRQPGFHRLYTLDLSDPRLGLPASPCRFLPLAYGFHYDATRMAYFVESELRVRIVWQDVTRSYPGFPYDRYPSAFKELPVDLEPHPLRPLIEQDDPYDPFRKEVLARTPDGTIPLALDPHDAIALAARLPQGPQRLPCLKRGCDGKFEILCVVDPDAVAGVDLWDSMGRDEDVQIVFHRCPVCSLIRASNQCT